MFFGCSGTNLYFGRKVSIKLKFSPFLFCSDAAGELNFVRCRLALPDNTNLWFLANTGYFVPTAPLKPATPFITTVEEHEPGTRKCFIIPDLTKDPRYSNHPFVVQRPYVTFFAGVPVVSAINDHCFGAVAVMDFVPREPLTDSQEQTLRDLSANVSVILQEDVMQCLEEPNGKDPVLPAIWIDVSTPSWNITRVNNGWEKLTGLSRATTLAYQGLLDLLVPENR